jgi:hypothetical protein
MRFHELESLKKEYDLVIFDDCVGGLIAGLIVRSMGGTVLCVEGQRSPEGDFSKIGPKNTARPLVGFHQGGLGQQLAELFQVQLPTLSHHYPPIQLMYGDEFENLPSKRINLSPDLEEMKWEFKREFPNSRGLLSDQFKKLLSLSEDIHAACSNFQFGRQHELSKRLHHLIRPHFDQSVFRPLQRNQSVQKLVEGNDFGVLLAGGPVLIGGTLPFGLSSYASLLSNALILKGSAFNFGGMEALRKSFLEALKRHGGHVKSQTSVEEILLHRQKIEGVVLSSFEGMIRTSHLVTNRKPEEWHSLVASRHRQDSELRLKPKARTISIRVLAEKRFVTDFLGPSLVGLKNLKYQTLEGNLFWCHVIDSNLSQELKPNQRLLVLSTVIPESALKELDPIYLRRVARGLLERMYELVPSLRFCKLEIFPDLENVEMEGLIQEELWYEPDFTDSMGIGGIPIETSVPGVFQVSPLSFPSLGLVGEMLAGVSTGIEVSQRLGHWNEQSESLSRQLQSLVRSKER